MEENNRNQSMDQNMNQGMNQGMNQSGSRENISNQGDDVENPQDGSEWGNYRTRELSSNAERNNESDSGNTSGR